MSFCAGGLISNHKSLLQGCDRRVCGILEDIEDAEANIMWQIFPEKIFLNSFSFVKLFNNNLDVFSLRLVVICLAQALLN